MINTVKNLKLAIIGLGYVGLPLAIEFGKKRSIVGYDIEKKRIEELNSGFDRNLETKSNELKNIENITFTYSKEDLKSDLYEKGVSCHKCFDQSSEKDKERFAQRQLQIELADKRGHAHMGMNAKQTKGLDV